MEERQTGYTCNASIRELRQEVARHLEKQYLIMSAPTPAQVAAIEALRHGEETVQEMLAQYDQRRRLIVKGLDEIGLPCFEPHGAFYAFPSIRHSGLTFDEFSKRLLQEEKVAVIPGSAFGQCDEGFVRCSYVASLKVIEEALERMGRFVRRYG